MVLAAPRIRDETEYDDEKVTEAKLREVINATGFKAVEDKPTSN